MLQFLCLYLKKWYNIHKSVKAQRNGMHSKTRNRVLPLLAFILITAAHALPQDGLPASEFSRLIRDLSEEGGYFFSDNFTSNEDSYLTVVDKMQELGAKGGAYIGVGPEQNFTYIAKVRPRIAFIVDIRRQAMIQHLMYKAIFHLAPTRAEFLSLLLSKPMNQNAPGSKDAIDDIVAYFLNVPADEKAYTSNLAAIRKTIQQDFQFPLSNEDQESLEYVYRSFRLQGFNIGFDINGMFGRRFGHLPNLREILVKQDLNGKQGNFLASADDYDFVRGLQRKNLIIPVVGDFGGEKALAAVGAYLKKHGYIVTVFYASNVEIVLFQFGSSSTFPAFVKNIKKLPINERSLLIRSTFWYYRHPAQLPGYALCTSLQNISAFLKEFDEGRYQNYRDLLK
jgi:hypothetical protein